MSQSIASLTVSRRAAEQQALARGTRMQLGRARVYLAERGIEVGADNVREWLRAAGVAIHGATSALEAVDSADLDHAIAGSGPSPTRTNAANPDGGQRRS